MAIFRMSSSPAVASRVGGGTISLAEAKEMQNRHATRRLSGGRRILDALSGGPAKRAGVTSLIAPFGLLGRGAILKGAVRAGGALYRGIRSVFSVAKANPVKTATTALGGYVGGRLLSGAPVDVSLREGAGFGLASLNPGAGIFGYGSGVAEKIGKSTSKLFTSVFEAGKSRADKFGPFSVAGDPYQTALNESLYGGKVSIPTLREFQLGDTYINVPSTGPQSPTQISTTLPSLSISGGFGGGGFDPALLALLLGGVGVGGYLLGKKRKKRKKRKKYKGSRHR